ncbi:MAG: hypothetical protein IAG10_19020 [Planctomycetaceae bacterium]|nr:hypothetical protein [Planctomycetaceae bacterium]
MRTWWQLLRQRGLLGSESVRARRGAGIYISDRALRLAAEVLEPRCLLTDATGLAADDGGGDILVDASQWDDAGLTLLRDGDLVHLVRTGTRQDVIAPFAADALGQLIIRGRDGASDVLTIDVSGLTTPSDSSLFPTSMMIAKSIQFDGGSGAGHDELHVVGSLAGGAALTIQPAAIDDFSLARFVYWSELPGLGGRFDFAYRQVELTVETIVASYIVHNRFEFGAESNQIAIDYGPDGLATIFDQTLGFEMQLSPYLIHVHARGGDDQITVNSFPAVKPSLIIQGDDGNDVLIGSGSNFLIGGDGNDLLLGGSGNDMLSGGDGNDTITGGNGDDTLGGGFGDDLFDGGLGRDCLTAFGGERCILGPNAMEGIGDDRFVNIEEADIVVSTGSLIDASAFPGSVTLRGLSGNNTLIGGAGDDNLLCFEAGNNLVIGGGGNDFLRGFDPQSDTLDGGSGDNTLVSGLGKDDFSGDGVDEGDAISNATLTLIDLPPANTLLGQGLDEPRDEDATLPETLVTDAESDGEDSGLNELDGQESNPADENDSTETAAITWDDSLKNPLLTDELLDGDVDAPT